MDCGDSGTGSWPHADHAGTSSATKTETAIRTARTTGATVSLVGTDSQLLLKRDPSWSGVWIVIRWCALAIAGTHTTATLRMSVTSVRKRRGVNRSGSTKREHEYSARVPRCHEGGTR